MRYEVSKSAGGASLSFDDPENAKARGEQALQYFLGSGHLGVIYLYLQQGFLLESPVAWYAAAARYDMKPGFASLPEMPPALPVEPACLRCHMSGVAHAEPGTVNRYAGLPFAQTGITCEGCHGDTAAHVQTGGKAPVVNPAKLDAERRDAVCISCHLEGDVTVPRAGRSALDWKPGERISDYLSYFVYGDGRLLDRGVSEVEQLSTSGCKRASGDRCAAPAAMIRTAVPTRSGGLLFIAANAWRAIARLPLPARTTRSSRIAPAAICRRPRHRISRM